MEAVLSFDVLGDYTLSSITSGARSLNGLQGANPAAQEGSSQPFPAPRWSSAQLCWKVCGDEGC